MTKRKAPGDLIPRTVLTREECSRGGESAARLYPVEQEEWGRPGGVASGKKRRARADAIPVKGYNEDCTCMRVGGYHDVLCRAYKFEPAEGW